jgi:type II secretory pathway component GspD/PulD (secretin)
MAFSRRLAPLFVALLAAGAAVPASAGDPPSPPPSGANDGLVHIVISDNQPVVEILRALAKATDKPILWSPDDKAIAGRRISPASEITCPPDRVLPLVRALLVPVEVALIPLGPPGHEFYYASDARMLQSQILLRMKPTSIEISEENVKEVESQDGLYVTTVIRTSNLDDLRDARSVLQRMLTQNNVGTVQEVPSARALIVTDFAPVVAAVYRTVKLLDAPRPRGESMPTQFFRLRFAKAALVRSILDEQFSPRGPKAAPVPGTPNASSTVDREPRFSADESTNQVVVTCREADLPAIRRVVEALDVEPSAPR